MPAETIAMPDGRFLVIGCGSVGTRHLSNLKQLGVTDIIAFDVREDRRREVEERFGVPVFPELASAINQGVRVVLVCTPTYLHLNHAITAARAGCHLFVEKPIADTLEGLDQLLEEVRQRGLVTLVGCNFRFDPGLRQVKTLVDERAIGTVVSARAQFGQYLPDWHPWEDYRQGYSAQRSMGGGVILDRVHEVDYLRWLFGEVTEVSAMMGQLSHLEVNTEDTAEILFRFASGALGSLHLDYVRRTYDCSLEVVGDAGTIQWSFQNHCVRWYSVENSMWQSLQWSGYDGNEMYLAEMRHFLRVLQRKEKAELDVTESERVLTIALTAKQGAVNRRVLAL